jgi:hypothetical protein
MDNNITIVTAFFEIGRDTWAAEFKRDASFYVNAFLHYLDYPYQMVCYIDDRYIETILEKYKESKYKNKRFIPINRIWLDENIRAWKKLPVDRKIINGERYKELLNNRLHFMYPNGIPETNRKNHLFPENEFAEYNVINHSKIDFIINAIMKNHITSQFTCWCDFGYFNSQHKGVVETFPMHVLESKKFHRNKISFLLRKSVDDKDKNMEYTVVFAPEVFTGTFFGGPTHLMFELQDLYHSCIDDMHRQEISDDDQHVYLRCYFKDPRIFDLHVIQSEEWPKGLTLFSN